MRTIKYIVVHCAATKEGQSFTINDIDKWHRARGWNGIGYHYVVYLDGSVHKGRDESAVGAHVQGYNSSSLGICYIGGVDANGKPKDTRTPQQKDGLLQLLKTLKAKYPNAKILGHREFSPDKNGDGFIDEWEWIKACPSFNASQEYKNI